MEFMVYFTACWPIFQESTGKGLCFFVKVKNKPEILMAMSKFKWVCCYMQDLGGSYSWGRCASINSTSARRFVFEAISSKILTDDALVDVIQKRKNLILACGKKDKLEIFITAQKKSIQHDFDQYLLASAYFYNDNFTEAEKSFQKLADHSGSPFTETSQYMVARTMMIESQKALSEYAERSGVDTALAEKAAQKFQQYLDLFPDGTLSASAKGLMRRCYWLAGQQKKYLALLDQFTFSTLQAILHSEEWSDEEIVQLERLLNEYQLYSGDDLAKGSLYSIRPLLAEFQKNNRKVSTANRNSPKLANNTASAFICSMRARIRLRNTKKLWGTFCMYCQMSFLCSKDASGENR